MMKFFQLVDDTSTKNGLRTVKSRSQSGSDLHLPHRWFLDQVMAAGKRVESWKLNRACKVNFDKLDIRVQYEGEPLDITLIARSIPVVNARALRLLEEISPKAFQLIPVFVGPKAIPYHIVNILKKKTCVDENRSVFDRWTKDSARPDKAGEFMSFSELRIDSQAAGDADLFRLEGWESAIIVSQRLKGAMEDAKISGVVFKDVT